MAIKEKKNELQQKSKVLEILTTEYKWETYLLGFLSLVAIAIGLLIFANVLTVNEDTPLIGNYPTLFAWIITIVGGIGLILFAIPVFKPAVPELKKLSLPTWRVFLANTTRVFIFLLVVVGVLLLYEAFITAFLSFINKTFN
jgi:preprotein translocase subunit SecE